MLSDEDREALVPFIWGGWIGVAKGREDRFARELHEVVERIASDAARAAERALVERVEVVLVPIERNANHHLSRGPNGEPSISVVSTSTIRNALRPEAATTEEGACTCERVQTMHTIGCAVVTPPNSCEYCGVIRNANGICWWCDGTDPAARPSSTRGGNDE